MFLYFITGRLDGLAYLYKVSFGYLHGRVNEIISDGSLRKSKFIKMSICIFLGNLVFNYFCCCCAE